MDPYSSLRKFNILQKISMSLMGVLVLITFVGTNLQALLWQSSDWLVSTVLPAVVVDLTNDERIDNSASALVRNSTLDEAAKLKAQHMARNEYFSHFSPAGVSPWHWFDEAGYVYAHAGENLAIHFTDSSEVVEAWMKSPLHRQNIVNGLYTEIGVGTAKGKYEGYDTVYVVQLFGTPAIRPVSVTPARVAVAPTPVPAPAPAPLATNVQVTPVELVPDTTSPAELPLVASLEDDRQTAVEDIFEEDVVAEFAVTQALDTSLSEIVSGSVDFVEVETVPVKTVMTFTEAELSEIVVVESPVISTSSGLAVAQITTPALPHAGQNIGSLATRPNDLLQIIYILLASTVVLLLSASIVMEARRLRFQQMAYGVLLLFGMGGLWFVNELLTSGAVVA